MSRTKKILRFVVALLILPFMSFPLVLIACIEGLSAQPRWDHFRSYFKVYFDMLIFKGDDK